VADAGSLTVAAEQKLNPQHLSAGKSRDLEQEVGVQLMIAALTVLS